MCSCLFHLFLVTVIFAILIIAQLVYYQSRMIASTHPLSAEHHVPM